LTDSPELLLSTLNGKKATDYPAVLHLQDAYYLALEMYPNAPSPTQDVKKRLLMDIGPLSVSYNSSDGQPDEDGNPTPNYYDEENHSYFNPNPDSANHAVLLVGWDDEFPVEKFNGLDSGKPENPGAWLYQNSWGTEWGEGGYFWISYEDKSLHDGVAYIAERSDNYVHNYGYDELGWCASVGENGAGWMGNVFQAEGSESLKAVAFYTTDNNAEYEISIYTDLKAPNNPASGVLQAKKQGSESYAGYHTVKLDTGVPLKKGSHFAVVVKAVTPGYNFPLALENQLEGYSDGAVSNAGESFYSSDGASWRDIVNDGNFCVKAFTIDIPDVPDDSSDSSDSGCNSALGVMALFAVAALFAMHRKAGTEK
jgi:hypothetical protein